MGWRNKQEAALACGIPVATWSTWETGAKPRDFEDACHKIANASGCDLNWLMTGQSSGRPGPDGLSVSKCTQPFGPTPALRLLPDAA
jgi:hypothetical protein